MVLPVEVLQNQAEVVILARKTGNWKRFSCGLTERLNARNQATDLVRSLPSPNIKKKTTEKVADTFYVDGYNVIFAVGRTERTGKGEH